MHEKIYVASDLGAGSGRVIAGRFDGSRLRLEETNRFENSQTLLPEGLHWDMVALYRAIVAGIREARKLGEISAVGIDTWGVDCALVDDTGRLLGLPYSYRDARLDGVMEETCRRLGRRRIYDATGTQFMPINTLFQLVAESKEKCSLLDRAARFLMVPDLFDYWLSGELSNELTIASTSQCLDVRTRDWAWDLIDAAGLPRRMFGPLVRPGTVLGPLRNVEGVKPAVVAVGTHDTASAVAAIPVPREGAWGCLSTGTWALIGAEIPEPVFSDEAYECSYTNEIGVTGGIRFMKNITGMWIYQELHRAWKARGEDVSYDAMTEMASRARPLASAIFPDAPEFARAGHMDEKMADWCKRTGQPVPQTKGEFARCALESMVLRYKELWGQLERITGVKRDGLNMIGGATRNPLHCQMTADALGVPVLCGPTEGAIAGNVLVQMIATGDLKDLEEARELVRVSDPPATYLPDPARAAAWDEALDRFVAMRTAAGL
ncbi:MAG: rhamnulokinase [Kiritimatiellae bacterium]|nr:rhamnulokinase [Kiritimatiellia bacterium]